MVPGPVQCSSGSTRWRARMISLMRWRCPPLLCRPMLPSRRFSWASFVMIHVQRLAVALQQTAYAGATPQAASVSAVQQASSPGIPSVVDNIFFGGASPVDDMVPANPNFGLVERFAAAMGAPSMVPAAAFRGEEETLEDCKRQSQLQHMSWCTGPLIPRKRSSVTTSGRSASLRYGSRCQTSCVQS